MQITEMQFEDSSQGVEHASREDLQQRYLEAACAYVNLATDDFHRYSEEDLLDSRFLIDLEVSMSPRYKTLADQETQEAKKHKQDKEQLYCSTLLMQLSLLSGTEVSANDILNQRSVLPSMVYRDILRRAGVFTHGVYTKTQDITTLGILETSFGDRFAPEFIAQLERHKETAEPLLGTQSMNPHLQLVA